MQPLPSERRYERLLASITDYAIYMTDVDGFITTWNDGARRIKGYNAVEIIGQHFSRFFTPDDVGRGLPGNILRAAREHGRHEEEGWRVRKDGSRFWANAVTQAVADEQGRLVGFAKITRDITERRAAQDALQRSEHRFRLLVDGMIDHAMYLLDPSGIVTSWNAGAERMKGYTPEEIVGHHFSLFYTPEDRASGLPARVLDIAAREGHYEADGWRVRKDGSRFWANTVVDAIRTEDGRLEGFAKITRDISERRAAQEALRQSERQFRLLVQNLTDYSLFMLDPNGIVTSWNAGAQRIKGYAAHEIIGRHFSQFYTDRDRAAGLPARALHRAMEEGRYEAEGWRVRKDGSLFWANVVIDRILDEKGALVGFAKITRDITERRSTQLALDEAQSQRAYAQKMDALGQLTGSVAHDFNNLLMIVSGHLARLRRAGDEARARQSAEAIEMAVRRGASLTRQLLSFSRRQPFDPTVIDLPSRIESVRAMLSSSTGSKIALAIGIPPGAWPIKVDASEFDLALVNLTLNARDAMPEGGSITISSENVTLAPADTPARLEGEFVAVRVTDSGTGIPPDILSKVFDPFFTTKDSTKGSGLGLSQVYGFAQQSGGTVTIDSELGRGTTVTLYLPRARHEAAEERRSEETPVADGRILLVEDNPAVADASSSLLEQLGYSVVQVRDAAAALQAAGDAEFDLVVSDIMMPGGMDGLALAHVLRERQPGLPILLMTGYHQLADEAGREFVLLRKPFDLSDLSRATTRARSVARATGDTNVIALPVGPRAPR
ncbi:MAG TPA: PAS domain S-box protein [Reyranella sp.]|nr:PAS domain S-box protein [Reyranella sp.]